MFKQSKLAAAVIAAVATSGAQAVNLTNDGTGQVLIFPYYNVNNNFVTQISLTNTTSLYKAVKIRFRESLDSNDTLDFNLYMSPQDKWSSVVRLSPGSGKANIITTDESCIYPSVALLQGGVDFIDLYDAVDAADTSEGYIEVIEIGVIADGSGPAIDGGLTAEIEEGGGAEDGNVDGSDRSIPAGLLHDSDGVPADCSVVADAWDEGGFTAGTMVGGLASDTAGGLPTYGGDGFNDGLVSPTGGLTGYAILLNTQDGAAYVADPAIIDNYASVPQHYRSDDANNYLLPSLASGDVLVSHVPMADGTVTPVTWQAASIDPGDEDDISPNPPISSGQNIMAISHVLAVTGLSNDYFVEAGDVNGATDWVITFPMKKHGVWNSEAYTAQDICDQDDDGNPDGNNPVSCPYTALTGGVAANGITATNVQTTAGFNGDDVEFTFTYYDTEEQDFTPAPGAPGFSPVIQTQPTAQRLTREVNVLSFAEAGGGTQSVLGTPADNVFSITLQDGWDQGWTAITFDSKYVLSLAGGNAPAPMVELFGGTEAAVPANSNSAAAVNGVPAIGFAAIRGDVSAAGSSGEVIPHTRWY